MAHHHRSNGAGGVEGENGSTNGKETPRSRRGVFVWLAVLLAMAGAGYLGPLTLVRMSHALPKRVERAIDQSRTFDGHHGPWGQLQYRRIAISMPDDYAPGEFEVEPITWGFEGYSTEQVDEVFRGASLTQEQLRTLETGGADVSPRGVIVAPPPGLVEALSPVSRAHIYSALARSSFNPAMQTPEIFDPELLDERLESSGLPAETLQLFRKLLYPRGSRLLFSDTALVLPALTTPQERKRFHKMVHRKVTFLVQLIVDETSDIDELVAYWDYPGRAKGLRVLLESLARVPGGAELDIAHVLPPFARERLYTFPNPATTPVEQRRDCLWTSMNFFNETPDDKFTVSAYDQEVIARDYDRVETPRFGDLAMLMAHDERFVHMAVYLADDLVFTKNGSSMWQPWMLMTLPELVTFYSIRQPDPLQVRYMRRKSP